MIVVVDASVVVKWFVREDRHEMAAELLTEDITRVAPELVVTEAGNAIWKKTRNREMTSAQAESAIREFAGYFGRLFPVGDLIFDAFDLSLRLEHPLMDCEYLALARHVGGILVSDDEKFMKKCLAGGFEGLVVALRDWPTSQPLVSYVSALDKNARTELSQLSALYQQTRDQLAREWFNPKVAILAEKKLEEKISALDREGVAHLIAACWLGAIDFWENDKPQLKSNWERHLANARTNIANAPEEHLIYIISKLHYLDVGLERLSFLAKDDG